MITDRAFSHRKLLTRRRPHPSIRRPGVDPAAPVPILFLGPERDTFAGLGARPDRVSGDLEQPGRPSRVSTSSGRASGKVPSKIEGPGPPKRPSGAKCGPCATRSRIKRCKIWPTFAGCRAIGYHLRLQIPSRPAKIGLFSQQSRSDDPPKYNRSVITDRAFEILKIRPLFVAHKRHRSKSSNSDHFRELFECLCAAAVRV